MQAFQMASSYADEEAQPLNKPARGRNDGGLLSQSTKAKTVLHRLKVYWPQLTITVLLLACMGLSVSLFRCVTSLEAPPHPGPKHPPHFADPATIASFLVVGDWGRRGGYNQSNVAAAMVAVAQRQMTQFVISTGDNFYPHGLNSTEDVEFDLSFRSVYNSTYMADVPWYAVLGNHDYGDGSITDAEDEACLALDGGCPRSPIYQLDAHLVQRDKRWNCARSYTIVLGDGAAELFFIDSTPFVQKYQARPWAKYRGGVLSQSWESQLKELETQLTRSSARWKILVAHHPVRSNGEHGDTEEMLEYIAPLMEAYHVRVAFHGHDHNLEHLHVEHQPMHYFVSGAGSKCRVMEGNKDSLFQHAASGFMSVNLRHDDMIVEAYGMDPAAPLYTTTIPLEMTPEGF